MPTRSPERKKKEASTKHADKSITFLVVSGVLCASLLVLAVGYYVTRPARPSARTLKRWLQTAERIGAGTKVC